MYQAPAGSGGLVGGFAQPWAFESLFNRIGEYL
jgi:hypothetical protein